MDCYNCSNAPDRNVPLLRCGHYICPPCYCVLKTNRIYNCLICHKELKRGCKKNKIEKNTIDYN